MLASCQKELPHRIVTPIDAPAEVCLSIEGVGETIGLMAPKTKSFGVTIKARTKADQLLTFTIAPDPDKVKVYNQANGTDYEMVPGEAYELSTKEFYLPRYNNQGSTGTVTIKADGLPDDGKTRVLPISITKVEGDAETMITAQDSTVYITVYRVSLADMRFENGTGTEADPYIVEYANDMLAMNNDLKEGEPTYIKLGADIDMSSIEEWMPVNTAEPYKTIHFDGDGHTISNMFSNSSILASLFGVMTGSVKNITFENCEIESGTDQSGTGLVAGKAIGAEFKNITIKSQKMNADGGNNNNGKHIGGLVGIADGCEFEGINVDVDILDYNGDGKTPRVMGGMVGICLGAVSTFEDCHVTGNLFGYHYVGGLIGAIGVDNTTVNNCSADVQMSTLGNYCGGFIGYANKGLIVTDSHAKGKVSHAGNYHGGFIGVCQGEAKISRCYADVEIENQKGTHVGAFIGNIGKGSTDLNDNKNLGNSVVEDCYASGDLNVTNGSGNSGRMNSGFIGMVEKISDVTVRRCYSSGEVNGNANGPIGGLLAAAKSDRFLEEDIAFIMEQCIAWNKVIKADPSNATCYSSAAIIGISNVKNTLTDNYRRADMEFFDKSNDTVWTLFDQENTTPTSPLEAPHAESNKAPYHGKAAPAGATCSQVAKALGWSEDIWDLSGEMPTLK